MKSKKVLGVLMSAAMVAASITGCGSGAAEGASAETNGTETSAKSSSAQAGSEQGETQEGASDVSGEVTFVSGNDQTGALDKMITEFNKKYPNIKVDHQILPGSSDEMKKSLMTSLAAGDTEPDVFECDIIWLSQFAAAGWLLDVTDTLEAKSGDYLAGPLSTCYFDDKAYAYPNYTDVGLLYYRSDLIETPPATWEEVVTMSKEHIGKDGIDYGYIFQMLQGEPTSCNMLEFIKQNGGSDLVDGKFAMNNSNTIEALEFVNSLIEDKISPEGVLSHKPDDTRAIFEEGKALFMRNWTYAYANANADTSKVKGKVGVTSLPKGPNGTESSGTLGGWNFALNANTDESEAAIIFAEFMSGFEAQKISTMVRGTFPTIASVYEDTDVLTDKPYLADVKSAADNAKPRPQVRDYATISSVFQIYFHKALTKELTFEDAMSQMDKELNDALSKMK